MMHIEKLVSRLGEEPRAIGAIAQLCYYAPDVSTVDIAMKALLKLLPTVKASDARYVSDDQMQALLALLMVRNRHRINLRRFINLPLAVLKALEQIGDSRAIEPVRSLTKGKSNSLYHQAARECLAVLEERRVDRDRDRFLLLPSSVEAGKETLLRAASFQPETQTELLLRAATREERE
jgi:hypothetical protein